MNNVLNGDIAVADVKIKNTFRMDEWAKAHSSPPYKDKAWLEWGFHEGVLCVRGTFSGWVYEKWTRYEAEDFHLDIQTMKKIVDALAARRGDTLVGEHSFVFNKQANGGEKLTLRTKMYHNGESPPNNIWYNQELTLQSYCSSASFNLIGESMLTPLALRKLADELEAKEKSVQHGVS